MQANLHNLKSLYKRYHSRSFLSTDPLRIVRSYSRWPDREVVGLFASVLAYGQVGPMKEKIQRLMNPLGPHPAETLATLPKEKIRAPGGWAHRFATARDATILLRAVSRLLGEHGSLKAAFGQGHSRRAETVRPGLDRFVDLLREACSAEARRSWEKMPYGVQHLIPHPAGGSACKRWNLYLRWMGRGGPRDIDPGDWRPLLEPRQLIVPLDVHIHREARRRGWTRKVSPSWRMAEEVTQALQTLDPEDPLRYDFALTRPGILRRLSGTDGTGRRRRPARGRPEGER
jgi:uncharacterized protein (TIGR02757 family)